MARLLQFPEQRAEEAVTGASALTVVIPMPHVPRLELVNAIVVTVPPVPEQILLGSLGDRRLQVVTPISVAFSKDNNQVIAAATEFNEFGFGPNPSEALKDLQRALCELYFTFEQEQARLGPDLSDVWLRLQRAARRRP